MSTHEHFDTYQIATGSTAFYPEHGKGSLDALIYVVLGLSSEAGEVAGKLKKFLRDEQPYSELISNLRSEVGDVLWYVARLAAELGIPLSIIADENLTKLNTRKLAGTLQGDGDHR